MDSTAYALNTTQTVASSNAIGCMAHPHVTASQATQQHLIQEHKRSPLSLEQTAVQSRGLLPLLPVSSLQPEREMVHTLHVHLEMSVR